MSLAEQYRPLAIALVKRRFARWTRFQDDLISVAMLTLVKAERTFTGKAFHLYAGRAIVNACWAFIIENKEAVRIPQGSYGRSGVAEQERWRARHREMLPEHMVERCEEPEDWSDLQWALSRLPIEDQDLLRDIFAFEKPITEIAAQKNIHPSNIHHKKLPHALERLRLLLMGRHLSRKWGWPVDVQRIREYGYLPNRNRKDIA